MPCSGKHWGEEIRHLTGIYYVRPKSYYPPLFLGYCVLVQSDKGCANEGGSSIVKKQWRAALDRPRPLIGDVRMEQGFLMGTTEFQNRSQTAILNSQK